ncbi:17578_t:CDS:2, partial [Racocetra fulgida]
EIKKEKEKPKLEIIEELKGIKRTTGQHPGGLLIALPNTDINKYTPLNCPADNRQADFLSQMFLKVDILGHDEPTVLQKLFQLTGIPEFGTDFVRGRLLRDLKPTKFSQLVQISGFSHGTNNIKKEIKSKLNDREGELYFSILSKIQYIFPKPHAIAYTMTA